MKISVVTISYNQAEFLERTIQSVIQQEVQGVEIEYIICDPGSTDGSRDLIEQYRGHFTHIMYEKDDGPADGLNKGFERATGDVFVYLNSDDTFEPQAISKACEFFANNVDVDVICGHAWVTDRRDKRLRRAWSEPYRKHFVAYGASVQIQPATYIRRDAFFAAGGFNVENKTNWDGELLIDLYLSGARIEIVNEFLGTYRLHGLSITNSGSTFHKMREYRKRGFRKLMGRDLRGYDSIVEIVLKLLKHFMQPVATFERLLKGPIFNRGED